MKKKILTYLSLAEIPNKKMEAVMEIVEENGIDDIKKLVADKGVMSVLSANEYANLAKKFDVFDSYVRNLKSDGIEVIIIDDENYPNRLKDLPDAPLLLYAKGDASLLNSDCFSIVGTRMPSNYGKFVTEKLARELAEAGLTIVSGLAYGVDSLSHRSALEVGGKTIAVLGGGLNHIYPEVNTNLAEEIMKKGLVISEYPPFSPPTKYTFPLRNRIIAGLSLGTLITEASKKSGTIHTKDYTLDYGRDLFAVPGNINSSKSELPNELIRSSQAECVIEADDILKFYGFDGVKKEEKTVEVSFDEQTILNLLKDGEQDFDYLAQKSQLPTNILNSCLTTLEIRGLIRRMPSKTFMLA